jgi:hypothetical protein
MKRIAILLVLVALSGCSKRTKIEPADVSMEDKDAMVAAVYGTGIRTNGLSVYYVERFTRGRDSWLHVQFTDAKETNPAIRPVYDLVQTPDGWKVVNKRDE